MNAQLSISFPAPESPQLVIAETETSVAIRFSFNVPEFSKTGKLLGHRLEHRAVSNLVSEEDFQSFFKCSTEKVIEAGDFIEGSRAAFAKKYGFTEEQAKLLIFTGYSVCRHRTCTRVLVNDPRWV